MHTHPACFLLAVGIGGELEHAAIADFQFLEKTAVRSVSGRERRNGDLVSGLQTASVCSAHAGSPESGRASQLEGPFLDLAAGVLDVHSEVGMRIDPLDFRYSSTDANGFVNVELRLDGMVRECRPGQSQSANQGREQTTTDSKTRHIASQASG